MPVLRERKKIPSELIDTYLKKGGCVSLGKEIWIIRGKRLEIATIQKIDEAGDNITVVGKDGKPIKIDPVATLIFVEPAYKIPKHLRK